MHTFAVTDKYVIMQEMPLRYSTSSLIKSEPSPFYAFDWLPESGSYMHVLCRSTGKKVRINNNSICSFPTTKY